MATTLVKAAQTKVNTNLINAKVAYGLPPSADATAKFQAAIAAAGTSFTELQAAEKASFLAGQQAKDAIQARDLQLLQVKQATALANFQNSLALSGKTDAQKAAELNAFQQKQASALAVLKSKQTAQDAKQQAAVVNFEASQTKQATNFATGLSQLSTIFAAPRDAAGQTQFNAAIRTAQKAAKVGVTGKKTGASLHKKKAKGRGKAGISHKKKGKKGKHSVGLGGKKAGYGAGKGNLSGLGGLGSLNYLDHVSAGAGVAGLRNALSNVLKQYGLAAKI